jgi:glucose-6-phosphate isomerase
VSRINISDYNLVNLTGYLGDIRVVEAACHIWNMKHPSDSVRIKHVIESNCEIVLTGKCSDPDELVEVCKYLTTVVVLITYSKTFVTLEF